MRNRALTVVRATGFALAAALLAVVVVLAASLAGPQFPSEDDLPTLPDGYTMGDPQRGCGSGGCYLEAEVTPPAGLTPAEAFVELQEATTACRTRGLVDRRSQCTGATLALSGTLRVSVQLRDFGK